MKCRRIKPADFSAVSIALDRFAKMLDRALDQKQVRLKPEEHAAIFVLLKRSRIAHRQTCSYCQIDNCSYDNALKEILER